MVYFIMCWRVVFLLLVIVLADEFNLQDESDYVDNDDIEISIGNDSTSTTVVDSTESQEVDAVQDEIKRLLGQPIILYDNPSIVPKSVEKSTIEPTAPSSPTNSTRESTAVETRPSKEISKTGLSGHSALKSKPSRARLKTSEIIYSVRVPRFDDSIPKIGKKFRPGVIERLVGAHEIVRYETQMQPTQAALDVPHRLSSFEDLTWSTYDPALPARHPTRTACDPPLASLTQTSVRHWTAYNEGGTRPSPAVDSGKDGIDPNARRQLVTLPAKFKTTVTLRPRPTPVYEVHTLTYRYTRRTRKHPNCTDSYYECLNLCFNDKGYRLNCPWYTKPPRPEPRRLNFTGLFWAILSHYKWTEYDASYLFWSWKDQLIEKGYRACHTYTTRGTRPPTKRDIIYYDEDQSPKTGSIIAKCWVCGLLDNGIPKNANCHDNFARTGSGLALAEKNSYRKYCRFMNEVPMWFNRSDPFAVFGNWTGGCSWRYLDLSGLYTQRACRSTFHPATGQHYLSKRMAFLEMSLKDVTNGCVVSPMATLVPFSRAVSLYARFHVCVCRGNWCNRDSRREPSLSLLFIFSLVIRGLVC